jgi:pyruvate kinase
MSIRFSIPTVAIAAFLTLSHGAIASAEVYKTGTNQVVITGLTAKQKYPVQAVNAKNKPVKRQDVTANTCGEALVDGGGKYKSLVVGTETIDPATLSTKAHARCQKAKTTTTAATKKKSTAATTVAPTTTAPITSPSMAPSVK